MQNSTDVETLKQYANEIIAEWQLRGVEHTEYKEAAQHLINHLRRKFEADRRRAREDAAAPKKPPTGKTRPNAGGRRTHGPRNKGRRIRRKSFHRRRYPTLLNL